MLASCTMKSIETLQWRSFLLTKKSSKTADIQLPMPDEPPVPPPRAPVEITYPYARGNAPPGTYSSGYRPFAGAGGSGGGGGTTCSTTTTSRRTSAMDATALSQHLQRHPLLPYLGNSSLGNVAPYDEFKPKILKKSTTFMEILTTSPDSF